MKNKLEKTALENDEFKNRCLQCVFTISVIKYCKSRKNRTVIIDYLIFYVFHLGTNFDGQTKGDGCLDIY